MTVWPTWDVNDPDALGRYVQDGVARQLLPADLAQRLPGPGSGPASERVRALYTVLADLRVRYVHEPATSAGSRQLLRTPDQVLSRPREGTCVDLAVTFAGMCLDAGLHPMLVILRSPTVGGAPSARDVGHAIVVVWTGGEWRHRRPDSDYPLDGRLHRTPPDELLSSLCRRDDGPGAFVAIDVTAATRGAGWTEAIRAGADLIDGNDRLCWSVGVDLGRSFDKSAALPMPGRPVGKLISDPYVEVDDGTGPLTRLQARTGLVPFHRRDELDVLLHWSAAPPGRAGTRIALIQGTGGAGKTHLAAEAAHQLANAGWTTGFYVPGTSPDDLQWLTRVVSPLMVVVDYAETVGRQEVTRLLRAVEERDSVSVVVLTTRKAGEWWDGVTSDLRRSGHGYALLPLSLPRAHPRTAGVFRTALRAFGPPGAALDGIEAPGGRWTTLELIMLAWLRVRGGHPAEGWDRRSLYDAVLEHEFGYWRDAVAQPNGQPGRVAFLPGEARSIGAVLSLLGPTAGRLPHVLSALATFERSRERRNRIATVVTGLLPPDPGDGSIAIRPDPVGEHLMLAELSVVAAAPGRDPGLLARALDLADADEVRHACAALTRAADLDTTTAAFLALETLRHRSSVWPDALGVASSQGGPFATALTAWYTHDEPAVAPDELLALIPHQTTELRQLAENAARHAVPDPGSPTAEDRERRAVRLSDLAVRRSDNGDHAGAMQDIIEAVHIYRALASDPYYQSAFAGVLNNLAIIQARTGDREGALRSSEEAMAIYRLLSASAPGQSSAPAGADQIDSRAGLAMSLTTLANRYRDVGARTRALEITAQAAELYRELDAADAPRFRPHLAAALNNLAAIQVDLGDRGAALATAEEAAGHFTELAQAGPAAYGHQLATALNTVANMRADNGDLAGALRAGAQAVDMCRRLSSHNSSAFDPDLAMALSNFAVSLADNGDSLQALEASREAVTIRRRLAEHDEAAGADLAAALSNLANRLAGRGEHESAVTAVTEAIAIYRGETGSPTAHQADLAMALDNQANHLAHTGRRTEAQRVGSEAVDLYRTLDESDPGAFTPHLAMALSNHAGRRTANGDRVGALADSSEAAAIYRKLAQANPAAFRPYLASALTNLASRSADNGDPNGALASALEAVDICRDLAIAEPTAYAARLATALNNLAAIQSDNGDHHAGADNALDAVGIYRELAVENPDGVEPHLAGALSTLSCPLAEIGDSAGALQAITEAVVIRRRYAGHGALPQLAGTLNAFAVRLADCDEQERALSAATEAVGLHRELVKTDASAFTPSLTIVLTTQSSLLAKSGDFTAALDAAAEALDLRRTLVIANPRAFLPDLASSLHNLATVQARTGDPVAAHGSMCEAVEVYRALAATGTPTYTAQLATALTAVAGLHVENNHRTGALDLIQEAIAIHVELATAQPSYFLPSLAASLLTLATEVLTPEEWPIAQEAYAEATRLLSDGGKAVLLAARAHWHADCGRPRQAADDLLAGRNLAEGEVDPDLGGIPRRTLREIVARIAETSEAAAVGSVGDSWVDTPLPDDAASLLDCWLAADTWAEREAAVDSADAFLLGAGRPILDLAVFLYPEAGGLIELRALCDSAAARGLEAVMAERRAAAARAETLDSWLSTADWAESLRFLRAHPELIADDTLAALGERTAEPVAAQHSGIVQLCRVLPWDDVYDAVVDSASAVDRAWTLLEAGRTNDIEALLLAAPNLIDSSMFAARVLVGVAAALDVIDLEFDPLDFMTEAAEHASDIQRGAAAARIARLVRVDQYRTRCDDLTSVIEMLTR
ncbi:tetratricopeptide repeat protein [Streptomyces sp. NPDC058739]|uniref:tetratricopeptide repeat protein n=1 Tax=Streptomyces sp. NPDC058739 TaxID=3346618 RepID=UPI0036C8C4A0